jgi:hypothetical protein
MKPSYEKAVLELAASEYRTITVRDESVNQLPEYPEQAEKSVSLLYTVPLLAPRQVLCFLN